MKVKMFNPEKSMDVLDGTVYFDKILSARVIESTIFSLQEALIDKIRAHYNDFDFLEYTGINERVLGYYRQCYLLDQDTSVPSYTLVDGLDPDILKKNAMPLGLEQFDQMVRRLQNELRLQRRKQAPAWLKLAINVLALQRRDGMIPIVYRDLLLDRLQHQSQRRLGSAALFTAALSRLLGWGIHRPLSDSGRDDERTDCGELQPGRNRG